MKTFPDSFLAAEMRRLLLKIQMMSAQDQRLWALWAWTRSAWWKGWTFGFLCGVTFVVTTMLVLG
jgi:hypothetical protein